MSENDLKESFNFVETNKQSLLAEHRNKFILVFDKKLVSSYDTYERAAEEGVRLFGLDADFLVYHLVDKEPLNFIWEANI